MPWNECVVEWCSLPLSINATSGHLCRSDAESTKLQDFDWLLLSLVWCINMCFIWIGLHVAGLSPNRLKITTVKPVYKGQENVALYIHVNIICTIH
jgi:hypothetical protein